MKQNYVRQIGQLNDLLIEKLKKKISGKISLEIEKKSSWRILSSENFKHSFVINPHNDFWLFVSAFSRNPFIRGNELVEIDITYNHKMECISIHLECDEWNENRFYRYNLFRKLPGYNDFVLKAIKNVRYKKIVKNIVVIIDAIVDESIPQIVSLREDVNNGAILKLKSQLVLPPINFSLLKKIELCNNSIESVYLGNLVKLNSYYIECYESFVRLRDDFFDDDINEIFQDEFDNNLEYLPILFHHIAFLEKSLEVLVESLFNNNKVIFFSVYNEFEKAGFFISAGENRIISGLANNTAVLEANLQISSEIAERIANIDERLKFNSYLEMINIYLSSRL